MMTKVGIRLERPYDKLIDLHFDGLLLFLLIYSDLFKFIIMQKGKRFSTLVK